MLEGSRARSNKISPRRASPYMVKRTPSTYTCYSPRWQTSLAVDVGRITRTLKQNFPWKSIAVYGQTYTVHMYVCPGGDALLTPLANFTRTVQLPYTGFSGMRRLSLNMMSLPSSICRLIARPLGFCRQTDRYTLGVVRPVN